jgi:hypothetical protein
VTQISYPLPPELMVAPPGDYSMFAPGASYKFQRPPGPGDMHPWTDHKHVDFAILPKQQW